MQKKDFKTEFNAEVERSLLLGDEDKQYWLSNIDNLPASLLQYFYKIILDRNKLVDRCIERAIQDDPSIVSELKNRVHKLKINILKLEETEDSKPAELEQLLDEQLKNL